MDIFGKIKEIKGVTEGQFELEKERLRTNRMLDELRDTTDGMLLRNKQEVLT